jgi:hypothetical protein
MTQPARRDAAGWSGGPAPNENWPICAQHDARPGSKQGANIGWEAHRSAKGDCCRLPARTAFGASAAWLALANQQQAGSLVTLNEVGFTESVGAGWTLPVSAPIAGGGRHVHHRLPADPRGPGGKTRMPKRCSSAPAIRPW